MKFKLYSAIMLILFIYSCSTSETNIITIDKNLITPGYSAEGYTIGETFDNEIFKTYPVENGNISEITGIDLFSDLKFDTIISIKDSSVIFLNKGIIIAIAGFKVERRVTVDAVLLSKGIDNIVLAYGNKELTTKSVNKHRVYIYKKLGIALFDDNNDNTVDMFLVFKN